MKKKELPQDASAHLDEIKEDYIACHPVSGHVDLAMAMEFFVHQKPVKDIALKHSFHEQTVHNRLGHIRNFVETKAVYRYVTLPKGLLIDISQMDVYSYKLMLMTFAKFQHNEETTVKRADIVSRFSYLAHKRTISRIAEELQEATASYEPADKDLLIHWAPDLGKEFKVYQSIEYTRGALCYTFTDVMMQTLRIGRMIAEANAHQPSESDRTKKSPTSV